MRKQTTLLATIGLVLTMSLGAAACGRNEPFRIFRRKFLAVLVGRRKQLDFLRLDGDAGKYE